MDRERHVFFPVVTRRDNYSKKENGEYYHYQHYRQEIRDDCLKRCVYCDIQEAECGGEELMELEHFRPQKYFAALSNDPHNLVYSCSGCNRLKSDHWPNLNGNQDITVTADGEGFLDPFSINRNEYFCVMDNGEIEDLQAPAKYMILLLALNRETRRKLREIRLEKIRVIEMLDKKISDFQNFLNQNSFPEEQQKYFDDFQTSLLSIREEIVKCLVFDL